MLNRLVGIIGWLGTALVFGALAVRFLKPEWQQYAMWAAWAGLGCVLIYTLGQWRDIAKAFQKRQAKYGTVATVSILVVLAILVAINYLASRQNKRWDLTANQAFSLSDQTKRVLGGLDAPVKVLVFARDPEFDRFRDRLREYQVQLAPGVGRVHRCGSPSGAGETGPAFRRTAPWSSTTKAGPSARPRTPSRI